MTRRQQRRRDTEQGPSNASDDNTRTKKNTLQNGSGWLSSKKKKCVPKDAITITPRVFLPADLTSTVNEHDSRTGLEAATKATAVQRLLETMFSTLDKDKDNKQQSKPLVVSRTPRQEALRIPPALIYMSGLVRDRASWDRHVQRYLHKGDRHHKDGSGGRSYQWSPTFLPTEEQQAEIDTDVARMCQTLVDESERATRELWLQSTGAASSSKEEDSKRRMASHSHRRRRQTRESSKLDVVESTSPPLHQDEEYTKSSMSDEDSDEDVIVAEWRRGRNAGALRRRPKMALPHHHSLELRKDRVLHIDADSDMDTSWTTVTRRVVLPTSSTSTTIDDTTIDTSVVLPTSESAIPAPVATATANVSNSSMNDPTTGSRPSPFSTTTQAAAVPSGYFDKENSAKSSRLCPGIPSETATCIPHILDIQPVHTTLPHHGDHGTNPSSSTTARLTAELESARKQLTTVQAQLTQERKEAETVQQALQLRLYIRETRLATLEEALDQHVQKVAEATPASVSNTTPGTPTSMARDEALSPGRRDAPLYRPRTLNR